MPDRHGKPADVVLGFDTLAAYLAHNPHFGATTGRVANRIARARFTLDGEIEPWRTQVFLTRAASGDLAPRDTREIRAARWATREEIQGPIRAALLATGYPLFRYRVALTDATFERMDEVAAAR